MADRGKEWEQKFFVLRMVKLVEKFELLVRGPDLLGEHGIHRISGSTDCF